MRLVFAPAKNKPHQEVQERISLLLWRKYTQTYVYDPVGNIKQMGHDGGANGSWTREYQYLYEDTTRPASNRLWRTWQGDPDWTSATAINTTGLPPSRGSVSLPPLKVRGILVS